MLLTPVVLTWYIATELGSILKRRRDGRARPTGFKGSAGESTQGI